MSILDFAQAGAAGVIGFRQGVNEVKDDQYREQQRTYQAGQQERTLAEQGRAEQLRQDLAAVPTTKTTLVKPAHGITVDDDGNPSAAALPVEKTRATTQDEQLRAAATALRKQGDLGKAFELESQADKIGMDRSAKKFTQLQGMADGADLPRLAEAAAALFNDDPMPQQVTRMAVNKDGSVTVDIESKDMGGKASSTFKTKEELLTAMQSYYSPASFQALQAKRQEYALKIAEEQSKVQKLGPGQKAFSGGKLLAENKDIPPGFAPTTGPDGETVLQRLGSGGLGGTGGSSGGAGAGKTGKAPASPAAEAQSMLDDLAEKAAEKLPAAQRAEANDYLAGVMRANPALPAATAARIALDAATNPARVNVELDPKTGQFGEAYKNPKVDGGRSYMLAPGSTTARELVGTKNAAGEKIDERRIGEQVQAMVKAQSPKVASWVTRFAEGGAAKQAAMDEMTTEVPAEALQAAIQNTARKAELMAEFAPAAKPGPAKGPEKKGSVFSGGFGVAYTPPAESPAGRAAAKRQEVDAADRAKAEAKTEAKNQLGAQFRKDSAAMSPEELVRKYDTKRGDMGTEELAALRNIERKL